jgi:hypothetical protein
MKYGRLLAFLVVLMGGVMFTPAQAGGVGFNRFEFVGASGTDCGMWRASGNWGSVATVDNLQLIVTDASGLVLSYATFKTTPPEGIIQGTFNVRPQKNPIHFTALITTLHGTLNDGDFYTDDPCLSAANDTPNPNYAAFTADCSSWAIRSSGLIHLPSASIRVMLTDGTDKMVGTFAFDQADVSSSLGGPLSTAPARNPIHAVLDANGVQVAELVTDAACLSASTYTISAAVSTPTLINGCTGNRPSRLDQGVYGQVLPGQPNALRDLPGLTKDGSTVIGWIPANDRVQVLNGPVCSSGYTWWLVSYGIQAGWTPEGEGSVYWLAPIPS